MSHKQPLPIIKGSGHRARLLERYAQVGLAGLSDYEVLELALTFVIPRVDTKATAKRLLARYGSISATLVASQRELVEVEGIGIKSAVGLSFLGDLQGYCLKEQFTRQVYLSSQKDVEHYLSQHFSNQVQEYVVVLYLDTQNRIMTTEIIAEGSVDHCTVYPRKVFDRALQAGAAAIIIAHNHPGGSRTPSEADWDLTLNLQRAGELLSVTVLDHIIIADGATVSMRGLSRWSTV